MDATTYELQPETRAFLARQLGHYVNGQVLSEITGKTSPVFDPGRGTKLMDVPQGRAADVDKAVAAARAAFDKGPWRSMKPNMRSRVMWKFADLIEEHS